MLKRLLCRLRGNHKIDLFPRLGENVTPMAYWCRCHHAWISREVREKTLNDKLERMGVA